MIVIQRLVWPIIFTALLLTMLSCGGKPDSIGTEGSIVFIVDEPDRPSITPAIEKNFNRVISTPQPEQQFTVNWADADQLHSLTASPIILLAAPLDGAGPTAELLRKMLNPEVTKGVQSGDYAVFRRHDPWARPQLLLILTGSDRNELADNAVEWSDSLFKWAYDYEIDRISKDLFKRAEQVELSDELMADNGFRIRVQHDYLISQKNDSLKFVRFIRHFPDRWIMIAWGQVPEDSVFSGQYVLEHRRTLGNYFLDPVVLYDERLSFLDRTMNGDDAVLINGLWATHDPTGGGPFFSYGIWNPETRYYYIIDGAVFAPGDAKLPFLWQLDAIAHTFVPNRKLFNNL